MESVTRNVYQKTVVMMKGTVSLAPLVQKTASFLNLEMVSAKVHAMLSSVTSIMRTVVSVQKAAHGHQ
jgi:hypothetical protein